MKSVYLTLKRWALRGWIVPVCGLLGLIAAGLMVVSTPQSYLATTTLFIGSPGSADSAGALQGDSFSQQRASTYAQLIKTESIAVKVKDDLGLGVTPQELSAAVTATPIEKTVLLNVTVAGDTPQTAADIANAYASNFAKYAGQLEKPNDGGAPSALVSVVGTADPVDALKAVDSKTNLMMGLLGGLVLGGALWWLLRRLDKTIRSADALATAAQAPVIGVFPRFDQSGTVDFDSTVGGPEVESARKLRTNVEFMDIDNPIRTLVVASPSAGEGAVEVAVLLALSLGEANRHVVLVDADFRGAALASYFGVADRRGLSDAFAGNIAIRDAEIELPDRRISFVPAGANCVARVGDLASSAMTDVIAELSNRYEYVVIVAPSILSFADCASLAARADGAMVVSKREFGTTDTVTRAVALLRSAGSRVSGVVLTGANVARTQAEVTSPIAKPSIGSRNSGSESRGAWTVGPDEVSESVPEDDGPVGHWPPVDKVKASPTSPAPKVQEPEDPSAEEAVTPEEPPVEESKTPLATPERRVSRVTDESASAQERTSEPTESLETSGDGDEDLDDWAPAVSPQRYTRSDIDPPTVAIRRDQLPKPLDQADKIDEPGSRSEPNQSDRANGKTKRDRQKSVSSRKSAAMASDD
ncbi:hypothetical protein QM716_01510 [Rhodococcus sp. IEGM 1409]|uniref:hypothetical protein n=1 Tax=Rhodococcus sp. IEGM 1409 TaxID=3047082 RepID=UPI0024B75113|nr:hypothetical protein [Rhodococcus sp. IEGM 1409]MDI9898525.1 hypothetical protein [Rhodococcus sp. IEGM 1409]